MSCAGFPCVPLLTAHRSTRHGECFVLKDGGESDLDLGNYERYDSPRRGDDATPC